MKQDVLTAMAGMLAAGGINYAVFLEAYCAPARGIDDVGDIVTALIGHEVIIADWRDVDVDEVTDGIRECLGYAGDESAGPAPGNPGSAAFLHLLETILGNVRQFGDRSRALKSFRFVSGHPAYPVFWDFAFLLLGQDEHILLIGSASD